MQIKARIGRIVAGTASVLLLAAGLTVVADTTAPLPAEAAQNPTACRVTALLTNGGFDAPPIPEATFQLVSEDSVPGWFTNDALGQIEFWGNGYAGVPAGAGRQFVELNANTPSLLYQDVPTVPGETFSWSLLHRGRDGTDTMRVVIGPPTGTLVQSGPNISDTNTAWGRHTGRYVVPPGQTLTRFGFEAVSAAGGRPSYGNFIDDISFGAGPCLITTKTATNLTRGGTTAQVGDVLRYTITTRNDGGNSAFQALTTDTLGPGIDIVPGSIRIVAGAGAGPVTNAPGDDRGEYVPGSRQLRLRLGDNPTVAAGGTLAAGASSTYTFDAAVNTAAAATTIRNEARVFYFDALDGRTETSTSQETITPVAAAADLAIVKTLDTPTLVAGQPATFTIGVTNNGPQTATGVTVTDAVPAALRNPVATPSSGSCTLSAEIRCSLADLPSGASASITVTATVSPSSDPGSALTNVASVAGTLTDPNLANNSALASGTIGTVADVAVTKSSTPAVPMAGQNATYTITTRNNGPSDARDVTLTDPLDPRTPFVSATTAQGSCLVVNGRLDCTLGTLAPGAVVVTTVVVRIPAGANAVLQNTASAASSTSDSDTSNNVAVTGFRPDVVADLALQKTASVPRVAAGEFVDFTLSASNSGPSDATNVSLDDTLPTGYVVTAVTAPAGATCTFAGAEVRCGWEALAAGAEGDVIVRARVLDAAPDGVLTNTASIAAPAQDPGTSNNSDSADVEIMHSADISVQKSAQTDAVPGLPFVYTLDVANAGPSSARGVTMTDVLPAGFVLDSTDGDCTAEGSTLTCAVGDLARDATTRIQVFGSWAPTLTGAVTNTATVGSPTTDPDPVDNTSSVSRTFVPSADVSVVKTASTPSIARGGEARFLVTVRNDGPSVAAGVAVDEAIPPGLLLTGATPSTGTWSAGDQHWSVGTLQPGESATLAVTADVVAEGALTNTVVASSQTPDPDPSDNTGTVTIAATASADLSIVKTASADPAPLGAPLTYSLVVTNNGPSAASAVRIFDALPPGLLAPSTPTADCTITAGRLECALGTVPPGGTFTATVSGTVDPSIAGRTLTNTAVVSSTTADPDPSDDTSTSTVDVVGTPRVELVKSVAPPVDTDGDGRIDAGDAVAYTFTIRNTGDASLTSAVIDDPLLGGVVACPAFAPPLLPGASVTCAPQNHALTQQEVDDATVRNVATIVAQSAQGGARDDAEANVAVPAVNGVVLVKGASPVVDVNGNGLVDAGDTIEYTFTVENSGTTTLVGAEVDDPMLGGSVSCAAADGVAIAPGASVTCAPVGHTLTQDDIDDGGVRNTAVVTAEAPTHTVTDTASVSADIDQVTGLEMHKDAGQIDDANGDGVIGVGDTVGYSFTARNAGTTTITDLRITDPLLGDGEVCDLGDVPVGGEASCGPILYTLTQDDIEAEHRENTATATGTSPNGPVVEVASAEVDLIGTPAIALTKTPSGPADDDGDAMIGAGDSLGYSFTVRNTGTVVLRDIVLTDPLLGGELDCAALDGAELAPQTEITCGPAEYRVTQADIDAGTVHNEASVEGASTAGAARASAEADAQVVGTDALTLRKSAAAIVDADGDGGTDAGDTIAYTLVVTNTAPRRSPTSRSTTLGSTDRSSAIRQSSLPASRRCAPDRAPR